MMMMKIERHSLLKEILCDFFIFTLDQIIVLNKHCTHNKPIPKISHVKTLQNLCKMRYKKNNNMNKKVRNKMLTIAYFVAISYGQARTSPEMLARKGAHRRLRRIKTNEQ